MVGMDNQQQVERFDKVWIGFILFRWNREHQTQKVLAVTELIARIHEGLSERLLVTVRRDRWQLSQQAMNRHFDLTRVMRIKRVLIKGRQRANHRRQNRHRVRVLGEPVVERTHVFVNHRVTTNRFTELGQLSRIRQLAVD